MARRVLKHPPQGGTMVIAELRETEASAWDAYVDSHPRANCYHLRAWKTAAEAAYGIEAPFLLAREGADGPVLADDDSAGEALVAFAVQRARVLHARFVVVKALGDEPHARGFEPVDRWVVARLPLAAEPEIVWRRFRDKTRNAVRKGQRSGLEVREGHGKLDGFYDVLAE